MFITLATSKAYANELCNLIIESQETGLKGNIKRTSGPSLAPRQEQPHNVIPDRCLPNIGMKKYALLFVFNMLPGMLTGVFTLSFMKVMTLHSLFLCRFRLYRLLSYSQGLIFFPFWGWEVLIYLVFAHPYACRMWKHCCRVLVSLTPVADTNSDESLQLSAKSCRNGCTKDFSAIKPRDSGNARKEEQKINAV